MPQGNNASEGSAKAHRGSLREVVSKLQIRGLLPSLQPGRDRNTPGAQAWTTRTSMWTVPGQVYICEALAHTPRSVTTDANSPSGYRVHSRCLPHWRPHGSSNAIRIHVVETRQAFSRRAYRLQLGHALAAAICQRTAEE